MSNDTKCEKYSSINSITLPPYIIYHLPQNLILQPSPHNRPSLPRSRSPDSPSILIDTMLEIPGRASPQCRIENDSDGLVSRFLEGSGVAGPLVMEYAYKYDYKLSSCNGVIRKMLTGREEKGASLEALLASVVVLRFAMKVGG